MFEEAGFSVLAVLFATAIWRHFALGVLSSKFFIRRRQKEYAGVLSRITIYPVKSMKGVEINSAKCEYNGLVGCENNAQLKDRAWMVIKESGTFVSARQKPKLVLIVPTQHGDWLHLDAPGMATLKLPIELKRSDGKVYLTEVWGLDGEGVDCGDEVAKWLSTYLETPGLRLLYHAEGTANRVLQNGKTKWHKAARDVDQIAFQDGFPFLLMTDSSMKDLNHRLETQVTTDYFRPNFVISTDLTSFDEDDWLEIFIGEAIFSNIKPCDRCQMTTVNPDTGIMSANKEPLMTLRSYRVMEPDLGPHPNLGINLIVIQPGTVRLGDEVYVTRKPRLTN